MVRKYYYYLGKYKRYYYRGEYMKLSEIWRYSSIPSFETFKKLIKSGADIYCLTDLPYNNKIYFRNKRNKNVFLEVDVV